MRKDCKYAFSATRTTTLEVPASRLAIIYRLLIGRNLFLLLIPHQNILNVISELEAILP